MVSAKGKSCCNSALCIVWAHLSLIWCTSLHLLLEVFSLTRTSPGSSFHDELASLVDDETCDLINKWFHVNLYPSFWSPKCLAIWIMSMLHKANCWSRYHIYVLNFWHSNNFVAPLVLVFEWTMNNGIKLLMNNLYSFQVCSILLLS